MAIKPKKKSLDEKLREVVEVAALKQIADAPTLIHQMIQRSLLSLLGLEDRGRSIEIDHCNGRNSVLIDAFRTQAVAEANKIAAGFKPSRDQIANFNAAFQKEFDSQMFHAIRNAASARAKEEAERLLASVQIKVDEALADKL